MTNETESWMEEARQIAAQCWCDEETEDREMDVCLAEAVAKRIAVWMDTAAMHARNEDFYRKILDEVAGSLGHLKQEAFIQDDGGIVDSPLRLKLPFLVRKLASQAFGS